jgi:DNA-binding PadR family transcriptional regulator
MSMKMAVLGLVIERPGYGYELTRRVNERIDASYSDTAVYPALDSLHREGLIHKRGKTGRAHRQRIWFEKTDEGVVRFDEWMDTPSDLQPVRGVLRLKIAVATFEKLPKLIEETRAQEQACLDRIERLTLLEQPAVPTDPAAEWAPTGRLVQRRGDVKQLQTQIEVLQEYRAEMKRALKRRAARRSG